MDGPFSAAPRIIGLTGFARSGKDSVAGVLALAGYERVGFADQLKSMALAIDPLVECAGVPCATPLSKIVKDYGWESAKERFPDVRRLLQRLGTEGVRQHLGDDAWVRALELRLRANGRYSISDVRFPNEADAVRKWGGVVWRVVRPDVIALNDHASERDLEQIRADAVITNDGTLDDLRRHVALALTRARAVPRT